MDTPFLPALAAIRSGSSKGLKAILAASPGLAQRRSSCSHPTLMQCLVLDGAEHDPAVQISMAELLLEHGSPVDEPLFAAASVGNMVLGTLLLDRGAAIDGDTEVASGWTPLEESIYWGNPEMTDLLLERGASVPNLRAAAALGRLQTMESFFDESGEVIEDCGGIHSPFGSFESVGAGRSQALIDNALVFAAMTGENAAAELLIRRGAEVNSHPFGFHYRGTALHWAAIRGRAAMCELLLDNGADPTLQDLTIGSTPAGWARHEGHDDLARRLDDAVDIYQARA